MIDLDAIGHDLATAYGRRLEQDRRRRIVRTGAGAAILACVFAAVAVASGIGPDLQLDPTKWSILGGGSVDQGRGSYVHAVRKGSRRTRPSCSTSGRGPQPTSRHRFPSAASRGRSAQPMS